MSHSSKIKVSGKCCIKVTIFQRIHKELLINKRNIFSCFRCHKVDYPLIKFEPSEEFNFEEQIYGFKVNCVFYTLILFLPNGDEILM